MLSEMLRIFRAPANSFRHPSFALLRAAAFAEASPKPLDPETQATRPTTTSAASPQVDRKENNAIVWFTQHIDMPEWEDPGLKRR